MRLHRSSLGSYSASQQQIQQQIIASAIAHGIDPSLPLAIAAHESNFNPNAQNCANANGTCDAGVMQINQTNWAAFGLTSNPYDPQANIDAGVSMIANLESKYGGNQAQVLCAYQYGPGRCSDPNNLPSLTPGFVSYVNNWIASNPDVAGSVVPDLAPDYSAPSWTDSTVNIAGYAIAMPTLLFGIGIAGLALWAITRR